MIVFDYKARKRKERKYITKLHGGDYLTNTAPTRRLVKRLILMGYELKENVKITDVKVRRQHWGDGFGWGFHLVYWDGKLYDFAFEDVYGAINSIGRINKSKHIFVDENEGEIFVEYEKTLEVGE